MVCQINRNRAVSVHCYSAQGRSLLSNNSLSTVLHVAWERRFGELIWLLVFNYCWGQRENLGLGELKNLHTDCSDLICSFGEGPPAVSEGLWLHGRWSAHHVLLISHICKVSTLCQHLLQWTQQVESQGLPLPYAASQSNHNLMIRSAWEWIRRTLLRLVCMQDEGLSGIEYSSSSSLVTPCNGSQNTIQVLGTRKGNCKRIYANIFHFFSLTGWNI